MKEQQKGPPAGNGGDVIFSFSPGKGGKPDGIDGAIVFKLANDTDVMRFEADGRIIVRGEQVASNWLVYTTFLNWLRAATVRGTPGLADGEEATIRI